MLENIAEIFTDMRPMTKKLNKKTYAERMDQYMKDHGHYYEEMFAHMEASSDRQKAMEEIADTLIARVKEKYQNKKGRLPAATRGDIDIFLLFYFFPGLLKTENANKQDLADVICGRWDDALGSNLTYADYDTLYNGFRERFLGLFRMN